MVKNIYNYKNIIENMPLAFAYHKVIYDQDDKAVDYIFLDVNKKFEEMTGLKENQIIGKKVTEVLINITESEFNWIKYYGEIALTGATKTINQYSEPLDKWYKIKAYSDQKKYFTTIFSDITEDKNREKEIENNKKRYQTIFNSAPIGFMLEDEKGKILEVNKVLCEESGYTKAELEGNSVLEKFILPEHLELAKDNIKRILQGENLEFDIKTPTKTGKIKDYHLKETNITLADGSKGIMSMHLDITERKKLENELKEKNNLLNSVLESIQDGIAVIKPDLTISYTNPTMEEWFGNELENKKCFYGFYDKNNACDDCPVIRSLKTGQMERTIKELSYNRNIDYIEIFSYPIIDEDKNEITGVVEFVRDISERVEQRKELEMMNFSINNADMLIFRVNPNGIIEYANETAFEELGYAKNKLIGLKVNNIIRDDKQFGRERYWEKLKSLKSLNYELSYMTKNKKSFPVEITSQYFKYKDKEYEFVFAQDITERIKKEKEINYLAYKDSLTDLYNRKFFEAELENLDKENELPVSIIMGDLNGLKIINDSYGQKKGDQLLTKTAKMLKKIARDKDILARYGGDEFTILLPQTTNEKAQKIIKKIKSKIQEENKDEINLSISLGAATLSKKNQKITETLKRAEDKMFQNKLSESRSSKNNIVQGLLNTLSTKSSETKEHAIRMTKLAFDFGEKLKLSNFDLNKLSLLATLHDIGKTIIPESILEKPGKLTTKEWEMIKEHPETGYKIASASKEFAVVADEILAHHERWDGNGYPNGLKKGQIPYLARIITIIDSYDVMTNDRSYSNAISKENALAEIKNCAGSQFDPELAATFIEMMKNRL